MRRSLISILPLTLFACSGGTEKRTLGPNHDGPCAYPETAVEPMADGEVIWPYKWPTAIDPDGSTNALDLGAVYCNADEHRDYAEADFLLFVSAPAT